jgi:hypothetical protein
MSATTSSPTVVASWKIERPRDACAYGATSARQFRGTFGVGGTSDRWTGWAMQYFSLKLVYKL